MTKKFLHNSDISSSIEKMSRKGMAQGMRVNINRDPSSTSNLFYNLLDTSLS